MGFKNWVTNAVLTASDLNTYIANQVIAVFASTAARDAAITGPIEGQYAYTSDTNTLWEYDGGAWRVSRTMYNSNEALQAPIVVTTPDTQLIGSGVPFPGTAGSPFSIIAGTTTGATDGSGNVSFTFAASFPNGVLTCLVQPTSSAGDFSFFKMDNTSIATNHCHGVAYNHSGTAIVTTTIRCNYIAIGW